MYYYGFTVKGIQSYIFKTNGLKEIIRASSIVEKISNKNFLENFKHTDKLRIIRAVAGNLRVSAGKLDDLRDLVLKLPYEVEKFAPGLRVYQAVVQSDHQQANALADLEEKLRIQQNKQNRPSGLTALGIKRDQKTGLSSVSNENNGAEKEKENSLIKKLIDDSQKYSDDNNIFNPEKFTSEVDEIADPSSWLAVIHADGNSIGRAVMNLKDNMSQKEFSEKLSQSTVVAARKAFYQIFKEFAGKKYPFRPVIIGGDDFTVICGAQYALDFTREYLKGFEKETKNNLKNGLTACAGIAFVKKKYPFHYAVHLAEELCEAAKKESKNISNKAPSSLMFHKMQSSFTESYDEIKKRELNWASETEKGFCAGPYFIDNQDSQDQQKLSVSQLDQWIEIQKEEFPVNQIRQWVSAVFDNKEKSEFLKKRIIDQHQKFKKELEGIFGISSDISPAYDLLSLWSIKRGGEK